MSIAGYQIDPRTTDISQVSFRFRHARLTDFQFLTRPKSGHILKMEAPRSSWLMCMNFPVGVAIGSEDESTIYLHLNNLFLKREHRSQQKASQALPKVILVEQDACYASIAVVEDSG